jgi:hypothetical protein
MNSIYNQSITKRGKNQELEQEATETFLYSVFLELHRDWDSDTMSEEEPAAVPSPVVP